MGIVGMTSALISLTAGAGYLLWTLLLHFEEVRTAPEAGPQPKRVALLFLTLAGVMVVTTLTVVLVQVQQRFTPPSL